MAVYKKKAESLDIEEPRLPRQHKTPKRFDDGTSAGEFHSSPVGTCQYFNIREYLQNQSTAQLSLLSQVKHLMQLLLVMPANNASSECSFSALRRVKMYLRATTTQERFNHMMVLHVHKDSTDSLDLKKAVNEFISCSEHRTGIFAKF